MKLPKWWQRAHLLAMKSLRGRILLTSKNQLHALETKVEAALYGPAFLVVWKVSFLEGVVSCQDRVDLKESVCSNVIYIYGRRKGTHLMTQDRQFEHLKSTFVVLVMLSPRLLILALADHQHPVFQDRKITIIITS